MHVRDRRIPISSTSTSAEAEEDERHTNTHGVRHIFNKKVFLRKISFFDNQTR